jgi:dihydroxy-acid dehydratase
MTFDPKQRSRIITEGPERAGARAMLKAIGFTDDDLARPIIGVANTWIETMPCNYHLRRLAAKVKEGIRAAGGTPMEFNTIAISDGVTMGTEGMKASLVSREVIADSIELAGRGYMFDAMVALVACDKTIPGAAMALARLDIPSFVLYGGSIAPGRFRGRDVTVGDVYEAIGAHAAGKMSDADLRELENVACRCLRWTIYRQYYGHGTRIHWFISHWHRQRPRYRPTQGRSSALLRPTYHGSLKAWTNTPAHPDAPGV